MTAQELLRGCKILAARDNDLAGVLKRLGPPPLWDREPGFPTLVHIILEQQVSLASARAAFDKLVTRISPLQPASFLDLDDRELKQIGFSGQKGRYCRDLAQSVLDSSLDLDDLGSSADGEVRARLMKITGIGRWTADIYLLMALGRSDVWPSGDLALHKSIRDLKGFEAPLSPSEFEELGEPWRPRRSVAARILWNHYLNPPRSDPTG